LNNELPLNEGEFLDILRERLELESKFNVLARINTRLSGGTPDRESKTNIKTETVVGKKAILGQAAVRASSHTGEVRLNGLEAFTIIDNLELTSADLRGEAEQESMHATQAAHEAEKIGTESIQKRKHESDQITHADRANVLNKRADDMLKLRSHLLRSLHSVKATASVPKPKVSVIS
ncbi:MAG TPA: hypothetical protein VFB59_00435, partial [Candidatus Saccharimonadales bacterium]|nr:hypothetical protein [Candidatus Saccharimonadales bacterium]